MREDGLVPSIRGTVGPERVREGGGVGKVVPTAGRSVFIQSHFLLSVETTTILAEGLVRGEVTTLILRLLVEVGDGYAIKKEP